MVTLYTGKKDTKRHVDNALTGYKHFKHVL